MQKNNLMSYVVSEHMVLDSLMSEGGKVNKQRDMIATCL